MELWQLNEQNHLYGLITLLMSSWYNSVRQIGIYGGNNMLLAVFLIITALFVVLGIIFASGKGANLIAGYNTASREEKHKQMRKNF